VDDVGGDALGSPGEEEETAEGSAAFSGGCICVRLGGVGFIYVFSLAGILLTFSGISFGVAGNLIFGVSLGVEDLEYIRVDLWVDLMISELTSSLADMIHYLLAV
jgi:hypothetical protein